MASSSGEVNAPSNAGHTPYTPAGRWFFTKEQLLDTPSVRAGLPIAKEISYRQQAANFIQDMGQHLRVTQLCINTAIVYTYRFYMFHSYQRFHRNSIALAALFLAAKVEEQPRKLEHVIKMAHICLNGRDAPPLDTRSESYHEKAQELVTNENTLLQTLGFDVAIDHPHTHVVRCCQLVKASKELAQASYYLATNSLHLTTMCLRYSPTIVACFCIHLACKWSNYKIPLSAQNKEWFVYVDPMATNVILEELTEEFLTIYDQCPSRLKKKIKASTQAAREEEEHKQSVSTSMINQHANAPHQPAVATPLVVIPHSSSTSRGHPQQQIHAHPTHSADADHQRRVASHAVRPPSQPHGATVPAKLPQGPSSIFDAIAARQGEKVLPITKRTSGQIPLFLSQPQHHHHHQRPQQPLPPQPSQHQSQQQQQHHQSQRHHDAQKLHLQQGVAVSSSSRSSSSTHHGAPVLQQPQSAPGIPAPHHSSSHNRSSTAPIPGVPSSAAGRPIIPPAPSHQQHRPSSSGRPQPSPNLPSRDSLSSSKINSVPHLQHQQYQQQQPSRPKSPPSLPLSATAKSIFDIDSPLKTHNDVPVVDKRKSSKVPVGSIFSIPSTNNPTMTSHHVQVKEEVKPIKQESGGSILLPPPSAVSHLPKVSKRQSLFSPPSDSESKPDPDMFLPAAFGSSTAPSYSAVKPVKTEPIEAQANQVRIEPIKIEQKTVPAEGLQLPLPDQQHHEGNAVGEDNGRKEKKHKEKKKKKEKSKDKDREREDSGRHHHEPNGESSSSSKKHKHKHKEKSKNRDSDRESSSKPPLPAIKLKIKALPPVPPPTTQPPSVAPIKISLTQSNGESGDSHIRKRTREELEGSSGTGPASKMSRVLGTSVESESKFLHVVGGNNAVAPNHLPSKSTKKVSSR